MDQQKYLSGVSVVIGLVAAIALVVVVALLVQAFYLERAEVNRVQKLDQPENVAFKRLAPAQREEIAADYSVLERNEAGEPVRIHLPIDRAKELVLESVRAAAK